MGSPGPLESPRASGAACEHCQAPLTAASRFCPQCGTAVSRPAVHFTDYEVVEQLAEGGMGRVYRAVQKRLRRSVCIKTLLPMLAADPLVVRRFEQEAITTATVSHPNVVSIFDVGTTAEGIPYLVMEYVEGRTLHALIQQEAPVPVERAIRLVDQVLAGLAAAHARHIIHRDLKPQNVLVGLLDDGSELCKVVDFGIARVSAGVDAGGRLTRTGVILGTPGYMAPEQILNEPLDHRTDLYAAGVLLYQLVTGQRVYSGTDIEVLRKALNDVPVPPSRRVSAPIPDALDAVCIRALAREREARFFTAQDFREALAQVVPLRLNVQSSWSGEFMPVAAMTSPADVSDSSLRAAGTAVIAAGDELERARLLEPVERALKDAVLAANTDLLRSLISAMQREQKERGATDNLKALAQLLKQCIVDQLPALLELMAIDQEQAKVTWVLKLLGRGGTRRFIEALPGLPPGSRTALVSVMLELDPDGSAVAAALRSVPLDASAAILAEVQWWPAACVNGWFAALLHSPDPAQRRHGLACLDERTAFQLEAMVRTKLHDPVAAVRAEALRWILVLEDEGATEELARLLDRPALPSDERRAVWRALGRFPNELALSTLTQALDAARDMEDIGELAVVLARTGSPRALEHLRGYAARSTKGPRRIVDEVLRSALN